MKPNSLLKSMIPILMLLSAPAFAEGGTEAGNGGGRTALEFGQMAVKVAEHLRNTPNLLPIIDRDRFSSTVLNFTPLLVAGAASVPCNINGTVRQVTACNHPTTQTVDLAEAGWNRLSRFGENGKFQLATHEVLGLMEIRDGSGAVSYQIVNSLIRAQVEPIQGFWCHPRSANLVITPTISPDSVRVQRVHDFMSTYIFTLLDDLTTFKTPEIAPLLYMTGPDTMTYGVHAYVRCNENQAQYP